MNMYERAYMYYVLIISICNLKITPYHGASSSSSILHSEIKRIRDVFFRGKRQAYQIGIDKTSLNASISI